MNQNPKKGIALLIAVVAVSALLLISLAISDIAYKEQVISYAGRDSKIAFYAADTGAECALFYDLKGGGDGLDGAFRFATSTDSEDMTNNLVCREHPTNAHIASTGSAATTTFYFNVSDPEEEEPTVPYACAIVRISKVVSGNNVKTRIESRGYNSLCDINGASSNPSLESGSLRNLERSFQISY